MSKVENEATGVDRRTVFKGAAGLGAATALGTVLTSSHTASAAVGIGGMLEGVGNFEVLAISWGASNSSTSAVGGGGGAGKASLQDISVTKFTDETSPIILNKLLNGVHLDGGSFTIAPSNKKFPSITYDITDVIVTSYSSGGSDGEDRLTENISLNFASLAYTVGAESVSFGKT